MARRILTSWLLVITLLMLIASPIAAATTADVTVTATPEYIAISDNVAAYDFGTVAVSTNYTSPGAYVGITNPSTVQTDITCSVTTANWSGGTEWTHSNTATAGADTAGMTIERGAGDVIVESDITGTPNYIYENCPATTDFDYSITLVAPSSFSDGTEKTIVLRITAAAG